MPEEKIEPAAKAESTVDMFEVLEVATAELKGIQAICTANAIQSLWNWTNAADLQTARNNIDYLLKRLGEENVTR